jgi:hypothetical protein
VITCASSISRAGSLSELEYYIRFLAREEILPAGAVAKLTDMHQESGRLLYGLWRSLKEKSQRGDWDRSARIRDDELFYDAVISEETAQ